MLPEPGFHAFTVKHSGVVQRIITEIQVSEVSATGPTALPAPQMKIKALWDTGASKSMVSENVVRQLGLKAVGITRVRSATSEEDKNSFLLNFYLPNRVAIDGLLVTEFPGDPDFDALIGMDIIAAGDFSISHVGGSTWMTYRIPSVKAVDFVLEWKKIRFAGLSRGSPCPCGKQEKNGSPVKFKLCCGSDLS